MALKRMFSNSIIDSDDFMTLSNDAQLLYFYLGMATDDDGFTKKYRTTMRALGINGNALEELEKHGFIYIFEEKNLVLIRDFKINNDLKNDRYHETIYQEEFKRIEEKDKRYFLIKNEMYPECIQDVSRMDTEHNITKHNQTKPNQTNNNISNNKYISNGGDEENKELNKNDYIKKIIDEWNKIPELENISNREKDVEVIISNYGVKETLKVIDNIKYSKFLRGMTNNSTWKVSLKWIIPKKNFKKILENGFNKDMTDFEVQKIEDEQALLKQFPKPIIAKQ
ncbi:hypothetical protein [Anaerococcus hydrogenalis]|uniref:hypothetical protein n=1 Tax=Anaerococcus hydrogenalis TaxID=33029 RepID=UPI002903A0F1|nr:hypothetical protein [Anaerococcus hydrogenalis]MDU1316911.1 hypothetical protein [Anaerococcus hydrogenalis]